MKCDEPEKIHNRAIRYFLGVNEKSPILGLRGDMGWREPKVRQSIEKFRLWNRLVSMDNSRLTKVIFNWDMSLHEQGYSNWSTDICN